MNRVGNDIHHLADHLLEVALLWALSCLISPLSIGHLRVRMVTLRGSCKLQAAQDIEVMLHEFQVPK